MAEAASASEVRVLVVDDDADSREVTAAFLRSSGFDVCEFDSAEAALPHVHDADAVVTDITLPGMNGYELARRVRTEARDKRLVLFALSGRSDTSPEQARLFDRVVVKPFDPDALVNALEASTGRVASADGAAKSASRDVALSPAQYRALVERAPAMLWRADREGQWDYVNDAWLAFTGRTRAEELGAGWLAGVHADDVERCRNTLRTHAAAHTALELMFRLRRHDGRHRALLARATPFEDERGAFAGFVGTCADVDDLVQGDRAKTTFLGMMSHELRTPLTPLRAYHVQIQRLRARGEPITDELVKRLGRQIDRVTALVEQLGDAARLSSHRRMVVHPDPCDLRAIVTEAVEKQREQLAARRDGANVPTLTLACTDEGCPMMGDAKRLTQMVSSIVHNAIKFSATGGAVTVTLASDRGEHTLVVTDEGIGIPHEELAEAGKPFFRGSNASSDIYPGLGVGLAIAKEIAQAHGGSLRLTSRARGTAATITLPASPPTTG